MALISCILLAVSLGISVWLVAFYRAIRESDFFTFTFLDKRFTFKNPFPVASYFVAAPSIRPINEFLQAFAISSENVIEITPADVMAGVTPQPLLERLHGLDFERIRLRLRIISSLDPVVNLKAEEGTIRFTCGVATGATREFELRSRFAAQGGAIVLEKLQSG